jgi:hypothetical protein
MYYKDTYYNAGLCTDFVLYLVDAAARGIKSIRFYLERN